MFPHWAHAYWSWVGGNVGAMPLQGVLAVAFAICCRKPIARWWHRHFGAKAELAEIRDLAARAHRIAADTYRHHTGEQHPDAPSREAR